MFASPELLGQVLIKLLAVRASVEQRTREGVTATFIAAQDERAHMC